MGSSRFSKIGLMALGIVAAASMAAGDVSAQESIFDPEHPDAPTEDDSEESDEVEESDESEPDNGLIIIDPEHPDYSEEEEDPDEEGDEDEDSLQEPDEPAERPSSSPSVFRDTQWSLDYDLGTLIDPGFGPEGQDAFEIVSGLEMSLRHDISSRTRAVVSGRFDYWAGSGRDDVGWRTLYEPRLDRAYLTHRTGPWALSFGQMRNSWGSTDIIKPGDVIDPVDMRDPTASGGLGASLAQLSASASYSGRDWSLRAVLVPFFSHNKVTFFGRDTALVNSRSPIIGEQLPFLLLAEEFLDPGGQQHAQPFLQATMRPPDLPLNASAGLRGTWTVAGTDVGLGAFYGWDRTPWVSLDDDMRGLMERLAVDGQVFADFDFDAFLERDQQALEHFTRVNQKAAMGQTLFDAEYKRRATILVDSARYIGPIGVRADVAFSPRQVFYTTDFDPVRRASVFSAVGLSYERLLDGTRPLALTVEGFWLHPFAADSAVHRALVPDDEGGDEDDELLIFEGGYTGVAGAANWTTDWWDLELTAGGIASIAPGDFIGRFSIARPWGTTGIRTTIGANLFFGPDPEDELTPGGLWAHNDRIHLAISGQF